MSTIFFRLTVISESNIFDSRILIELPSGSSVDEFRNKYIHDVGGAGYVLAEILSVLFNGLAYISDDIAITETRNVGDVVIPLDFITREE